MKKILTILTVLILSIMLGGCNLDNDKKKMDENNILKEEVVGEVSDDNSLETIEEEINDTDLLEFEAELDNLDQEIDQL